MNYITYGHTDYIDILKIHTAYLPEGNKNTLFINSQFIGHPEFVSKYDRVVYYDDSKPYASRMLECLSQVNDEYFLLILDTDIILNHNGISMAWLYKNMKVHNIDRIDLKQTFNFASSTILDIEDFSKIYSKDISSSTYLVRSEDPNDYIYNLNPSIWKKEAFVDMLSKFPDKNYREIEGGDVQQYCKKFNIFKMHSKEFLECGWFRCVPLFKFLHISHGGRLLPLNDSFTTPSGQSYVDCYKEYLKIYADYNLKDIKLKHFLG